MNKGNIYIFTALLLFLYLCVPAVDSIGQDDVSPLEFLKEQELRNKDNKGEIYLGKVMTILYPAYSINAGKEYYPLLLELTDVIKSPLRKNYRIVIKGYTDNTGKARENLEISVKRAETLKQLFIEKYYIEADRITTEGHGEADPVASNKTAEERNLNRRVEIHIHGDVSEAVKFIER
ncbi:MAG: OmpA family protein [Deltaproteobacteria bacterium]|nr:OmpA family protein [Deltaproteobacteria bacterium]